MDSAFVLRSLRMAAGLSLLGGLFVAYYFGYAWSLGMVLGAFWSIANLFLIKVLVERLITRAHRPWKPLVLLVLVKFPLLYGVGYYLLSRTLYDIKAPLLGFMIPFAVLVLKAGGRLLLGIDGPDSGRRPAGAGLKH